MAETFGEAAHSLHLLDLLSQGFPRRVQTIAGDDAQPRDAVEANGKRGVQWLKRRDPLYQRLPAGDHLRQFGERRPIRARHLRR